MDINDRICLPICGLVWNSVRKSVWSPVVDSVRGSVEFLVWDSVYNSIESSVEVHLKTYDFKN